MKWSLMEDAITVSDRLKLASFCLTANKFTNGDKVKELENNWNNWLGSEYSLFVSSGSTANFLLIASIKELYNLKDGDKVLVPACTWMTNVAPIIQLGLTPIFCDIQFSDFSFNFQQLEVIAKNHPDIKLIFVTHLLGFSSKSRYLGLLDSLFPKALIIDDVCESHGCKDDLGNKIGSNSLGSTFSTYFGHHLTSIEGGFVSTNNVDLYDLMKMKRSHGMARESENYSKYASKYPDIDKSFLFITDGYNFRNTELNAVLGLSQLKRLNNSINIRNNNHKHFCDMLKSYDNLFYPIEYSKNNSSFCLPFICASEQIKTKLENLLIKCEVEYRPIVSGNLLRHPFLSKYKHLHNKTSFYNVEQLHTNGLYIGNNQFVNRKKLSLLEEILELL